MNWTLLMQILTFHKMELLFVWKKLNDAMDMGLLLFKSICPVYKILVLANNVSSHLVMFFTGLELNLVLHQIPKQEGRSYEGIRWMTGVTTFSVLALCTPAPIAPPPTPPHTHIVFHTHTCTTLVTASFVFLGLWNWVLSWTLEDLPKQTRLLFCLMLLTWWLNYEVKPGS